jgi:hypothetical protein
VSSLPRVPQKALHEVLREEWQSLAREILFEDPEDSCPHLHALRLHAQRRIDEYTCLLESGLSVT